MADNTILNTGSGGDTVATDDIGGIKYPRSKIVIGADGTNDGDVSSTNPLPAVVTNAGTFAVQVNGALLTSAQLIDDGIATTGSAITTKGMAAVGTDGTDARILKTDTSGELQVDVLTMPTITVNSHAVTNAGTFVVQENGAALTALQLLDDVVATDGSAALTKGNQVCGTDGTNAQIISTNTSGHVNIADGGNSITVDNGGTFAVQATCTNAGTFAVQAACTNAGTFVVQENGAALTSLQLIDDPVIADDAAFTPATSKVMMAGFQFDDAATDSVDEGDAGAARMSANRNVYTQIRDAAGNERGANVNASNQLAIAGPVTNAGTFAVQSASAGDIAHDAADSGNPIKIGARAVSTISGTTAVASLDRTDLFADLDGVLPVRFGGMHGDFVSGNASNTDGTSTQVLAAGAANVRHYLTDITLTNASTTFGYCELKDGTTVMWTLPIPPQGGVTHRFATPLKGTAATAWNFDPSAALTTVYCSVAGYKSKV